MAWTMPAESAPQERLWMAFPHGPNAGDTPAEARAAHEAWAAVANTASEFEPVTMVVDADERDDARRLLSSAVTIVEAPLDDAWMRDIGPTFVLDDDGRLGAVDWVFNGWGAQDWASWEHDARIGSVVAELAGATRIPSQLVNEGGGIHVDGSGTVLLTETVQRDPGRNPGISRAEVEAELARTIGATHPIWLPRGLTRDYERYGTRGHVDIVASLVGDGTVLVHRQDDAEHPHAAVSREIERVLADAVDASGRSLEIVHRDGMAVPGQPQGDPAADAPACPGHHRGAHVRPPRSQSASVLTRPTRSARRGSSRSPPCGRSAGGSRRRPGTPARCGR